MSLYAFVRNGDNQGTTLRPGTRVSISKYAVYQLNGGVVDICREDLADHLSYKPEYLQHEVESSPYQVDDDNSKYLDHFQGGSHRLSIEHTRTDDTLG